MQLTSIKRASLSVGRLIDTSNNLSRAEKKKIASLKSITTSFVYNTENGFEDVVCEWVDVLEFVSRIKSVRKRSIIAYRAIGYCNWEIAEIMRLSEKMIDKHLAQIKNILKKR